MERKKRLTPAQIWAEVLSYHEDFDSQKMEVLCDGVLPLRVTELKTGEGIVGADDDFLFYFEGVEQLKKHIDEIY